MNQLDPRDDADPRNDELRALLAMIGLAKGVVIGAVLVVLGLMGVLAVTAAGGF